MHAGEVHDRGRSRPVRRKQAHPLRTDSQAGAVRAGHELIPSCAGIGVGQARRIGGREIESRQRDRRAERMDERPTALHGAWSPHSAPL